MTCMSSTRVSSPGCEPFQPCTAPGQFREGFRSWPYTLPALQVDQLLELDDRARDVKQAPRLDMLDKGFQPCC